MKRSLAILMSLSFSLPLQAGLEPEKQPLTPAKTALQLSLEDTFSLALAQNPELIIRRLDTQQTRNTLSQAWGYFEPTLAAFFGYEDHQDPTSSPFQIPGPSFFDPNLDNGVNKPFTITSEEFLWGANLTGLTPLGGTYGVYYNQSYLTTDEAFTALVPQVTGALYLAFRQPFLRDAGIKTNLGAVTIAKNNVTIAKEALNTDIENTLQQVHRAYLELVYALQVRTIIKNALDYAREIERLTQARIKAGIDTEISLWEAKTRVATREEKLVVAEFDSIVAEENLKLLLSQDRSAEIWQKSILPLLRPEYFPYVPDEQEELGGALQRRHEIKAVKKELQSSKLAQRIRFNHMMPRLDFIAEVGWQGLDGEQKVLDPLGNEVGDFTGGINGSLDDILGGEYPYYELGVEFSWPLGNSVARADYRNAKLTVQRQLVRKNNLEQKVAVELKTTARGIRLGSQRVKASQTAYEASTKRLKAGENKHRLGVLETRRLLELEEEKDELEASRLRSVVDYHLSVVGYERAKGTLAEYFKLKLNGESQEEKS